MEKGLSWQGICPFREKSDYCVSPSPFDLDFGTLDFGTSDSGLTIYRHNFSMDLWKKLQDNWRVKLRTCKRNMDASYDMIIIWLALMYLGLKNLSFLQKRLILLLNVETTVFIIIHVLMVGLFKCQQKNAIFFNLQIQNCWTQIK